MNETVTVVIPSRNEENFIGKCLDSFMSQSYPKELMEVFVCDGMSGDKTREIVNEYSKKYGNVFLIDNPGLSAPKGMNEGIKKSKSDIVIIFGAHAHADVDFVKNNVLALQNNEIGCSGGPIKTVSTSLKGEAISEAMSSPFGVGNALFRYATERAYVDTVAFGAYRKGVLDSIGYFDEELVRNQDDELNFRVTKNNYKIILDPDIKSTYYSRASLKKLWKQYYQYGFWKVRVMQKHGKTSSIRHLIPLAFVTTNMIGALGSFFCKPIRMLWILELLLYFTLDIIFSVKKSKGNIKILGYLFIIFPILHLSYGIGFLEGLITFYLLKSKNSIDKNTKMSR
ncbi:glycosyltransferase family 2 protein [Hathewaya histolytica]|uniref:Succinoglycan biosynthesis protein exoA n=1 Tax=Hathewaya histolytica TaxID=1498 RepID=A0A4U9RS91_HATHI|nr:glycosyltransferase family 2 protein [Hathewaya histolytica]VTQ94426.1 succinoglycan biosynthesis protein exoA [Hathewaya histolytica]